MTIIEVLKQGSRIVASLIAEKTPPIFETLRKACVDLGDLVTVARQMDGITPEFARGMTGIVARLEVFKASDVRLDATEEKKFADVDAFGAYLKDQVDKAIAEQPNRALVRLHTLQAGMSKALGDLYAGPGNDSSVTLSVFIDPWQQASVEREGGSAPKVTSGTAQREEVSKTPGIGIADVLKGLAKSVEDAAAAPFDVGWALDLATKEFLYGVNKRDWGRDGSKG